jgi:hypothetical protein
MLAEMYANGRSLHGLIQQLHVQCRGEKHCIGVYSALLEVASHD